LPWKESLKQLCELGLKPEVERKVLRENAMELFNLAPAEKQPTVVETIPQTKPAHLETALS
jgi:hypothetical protein